MKYYLLCFQTSGRLIIFFNNHDYQVLTSFMKENKKCKRLKTAKWISIRCLVPGLFTHGQISWIMKCRITRIVRARKCLSNSYEIP